MRKTMSDLPEELVEEILYRVPMTSLGSVRSTCKKWNSLSRNWIFGKEAETKNQFLGLLLQDKRIYSVEIDLHGIPDGGLTELSINHVGNSAEVHKAYHCDGLILLWILYDAPKFMVWNPDLGQTRLILPMFNSFCSFALGYDNNRNHKILHILDFNQHKNRGGFYGFNIYEFSSDSWRDLDLTHKWKIPTDSPCVSLKGNAFFYAQEEEINMEGERTMKHFLLCFDFTSERFGQHLSLPFHYFSGDNVSLSCVRDNKQLAVLYQTDGIMEFWVTNKIDNDEVLWTNWMQVNTYSFVYIPINPFRGSFFIDEENEVLVVVDQVTRNRYFNQTAYIMGQDGYSKMVSVGKSG